MQKFDKFHCHIYFDESNIDTAKPIYQKAKKDFGAVNVGKFHEELVGPHLKPNFRISFKKGDFLFVNLWLMNNRQSHVALVHADTGYDFIDHTQRCFWYGKNIGLDYSKLDPDPSESIL